MIDDNAMPATLLFSGEVPPNSDVSGRDAACSASRPAGHAEDNAVSKLALASSFLASSSVRLPLKMHLACTGQLSVL